MATKVAAMNGYQLLVKLGNGASPETFAHPCSINTTRGIRFGSRVIESSIPYCGPSDSNLAAWVEREIDDKTATISGAGTFDTESLAVFWDWYDSAASKHIQVWVGVSADAEGGYWDGSAVLSEFEISGERKGKVEFTCTILSDGEIAWHDAGT